MAAFLKLTMWDKQTHVYINTDQITVVSPPAKQQTRGGDVILTPVGLSGGGEAQVVESPQQIMALIENAGYKVLGQ